MEEPKTQPMNPILQRRPSVVGAGEGAGMDKTIKKRTFTPRRLAMIGGIVLFLALVAYGYSTTTGGKKLNVEQDKLTIATVAQGPFQEYVSQTGNVMPQTQYFIDAVQGGRVEEIYVREGAQVTAGQALAKLSNTSVQMQLLNNETSLNEQVSLLQQQRFQVEQQRLATRQSLIQMDYEIQRLRRQHARNEELMQKDLIAREEYERVKDELDSWERRRDLTLQSFRSDSLAQEQRLQATEENIDQMRASFALLRQSLDNLTVRAPIAGQLSLFTPELGSMINAGARIGQVDELDNYKVRAGIDEFYLARVFPGQTATTQPIGGQEYRMTITRVYPEVRDGRFEVDLDFMETPPDLIRRGQTIRFRLELGDPGEAILLPQGGFYQTTGGNWVYAIDESGNAVRRNIRLGRKNDQHFEVLEGLQPGDRVITSSYDTFGDADRLILQ